METFVGDTIRITVQTGIDLSGYASLYIKFKRPNGTIGRWPAILDLEDNENMYYDTDETDLDIEGDWYFQADAKNAVPAVDLHGDWFKVSVKMPFADTTSPPTTAPPTTEIP